MNEQIIDNLEMTGVRPDWIELLRIADRKADKFDELLVVFKNAHDSLNDMRGQIDGDYNHVNNTEYEALISQCEELSQ